MEIRLFGMSLVGIKPQKKPALGLKVNTFHCSISTVLALRHIVPVENAAIRCPYHCSSNLKITACYLLGGPAKCGPQPLTLHRRNQSSEVLQVDIAC